MKIDVTIIIVNYNTTNLVFDCIASIKQIPSKYTYEIIVVDNASIESLEIIEECEGINLIKSPTNVGFGSANNIASRVAKGEYLLFLNSDTIIYRDVISDFVDSYRRIAKTMKIGAIGMQLFDINGQKSHSYGDFPRDLKRKLHNNNSSHYFSHNVDVVIGADLFIHSDTFRLINGFDEQIFLYEEEMEMQYRLNLLGYTNMIISASGIIHLEGKSSTSYFKRQCSFKSLCYIRRKHLPLPQYYFWRIKWFCCAMIFFKNRQISWREKIDYLKLTLTYLL